MILRNGLVYYKGEIIRRDIEINENRIAKIGKKLEGEGYNAENKLILPGLVNTHTHLAMTLLRGYADDLPLNRWLEEYIWPSEDKLTEEDVYYGSLLGIIEMIKSGTTCFNDMYFFMDRVADAVAESGIRGVLSHGIIELSDKEKGKREIKKSMVLMKKCEKNDRTSFMFGPHAPYTCSREFLMHLKELSHEYDKKIHMHLSETKKEVEDIKNEHGVTPIEYLKDFLDENVLAAHCVHLTKREIAILREKKVKVSHNPVSNTKLSSGIAPIPELLKNRVLVSLGTDGAASNNSLNMFEDLKVMALIHKLKDPTALNAEKALEIATENGGKALDLSIGKIAEGYLADLIFVDLNSANLCPAHNIISNLVYSFDTENISDVMINGKFVMKNREILTLREEKILEKANKRAKDLVTR
ncbi:MAG: amidohydrolase [Euryarchaeota archaeon]|nr:amidohydrolase [Euryarchaeota archaeon]